MKKTVPPEEIVEFAKQRLASFKVPRYYEYVDDLPRTPSERVEKHKLIIEFVEHYTTALRNIVSFRVYERLFSLWHILHLPLFIMMIITAVVHIFAVHLY